MAKKTFFKLIQLKNYNDAPVAEQAVNEDMGETYTLDYSEAVGDTPSKQFPLNELDFADDVDVCGYMGHLDSNLVSFHPVTVQVYVDSEGNHWVSEKGYDTVMQM